MLRTKCYLLLLTFTIPAHADMQGGGMMGPSGSTAAPSKQASSTTHNGYQLTQEYCVQCHQSPSPNLHSPGDWPSVVSRMIGHMRAQAMHFPNKQDEQLIIEYLGKS